MIEDAKRGWIEDALEHGDPVPEPRFASDFSGKVNLRMPKSLHRDLVRLAEAEGVSLNQLMVAALARAVGEQAAPTVRAPANEVDRASARVDAGRGLWPKPVRHLRPTGGAANRR